MGDIKCLTAYKLGHPRVEHPITLVHWCQEGQKKIGVWREHQVHSKAERK